MPTPSESLPSNQSSSKLLRLAPELTTKIWTLVLGNQTIHIRPNDDYECQGIRGAIENPKPTKIGVTHVVCKVAVSEQEAYNLSQSEEYEKLMVKEPKTELYKRKVTVGDELDSRIRHDICYPFCSVYKRRDCTVPNSRDCAGHMSTYLNLHLLRVCRQIYQEANFILWSSTTWSFSLAISFYRFMNSRNEYHRGCLRRIHLEFHGYISDIGGMWNRVINQTIKLQNLTAVEVLHLDFRDVKGLGAYERFGFQEFKSWPLKHVTVIFADSEVGRNSTFWHWEEVPFQKSRQERVLVAEKLRARLLGYGEQDREEVEVKKKKMTKKQLRWL